MTDEDDDLWAEMVRAHAKHAVEQGPGWGLITHEDPFGRRLIGVARIGSVWEKHGVDARDVCRTCEMRRLEENSAPVHTMVLGEGEDADALVRPLSEALEFER